MGGTRDELYNYYYSLKSMCLTSGYFVIAFSYCSVMMLNKKGVAAIDSIFSSPPSDLSGKLEISIGSYIASY